MREKKEPLVIECAGCKSRFRLWIPVKAGSEWEQGARINCVRCGAAYIVRKAGDGFHVEAGTPPPPPEQEGGFAIESGNGLTPLSGDETGAAAEGAGAAPEATEASAGPEEAAEALAEPAILVVEDDALSRKMVENSLGDMAARLILVKNGEDAVKVLRSEEIALLVVDLYLKSPDDPSSTMDGEEVLKEAAGIADIPAIVVTGKELVDDISLDPKWFDLHVKDFIQKGNPFWVDELKVKVTDIIAKR